MQVLARYIARLLAKLSTGLRDQVFEFGDRDRLLAMMRGGAVVSWRRIAVMTGALLLKQMARMCPKARAGYTDGESELDSLRILARS